MLQNMADALREGIHASSVVSEYMSEEMSEKENALLALTRPANYESQGHAR